MRATIHEPGPTLDDAALDSLEHDLGVALPVAYRTFLQQHNGGYPDPNVFFRETNNRKGRQFAIVSDFFGIDDVRMYREWHVDRVPRNLLAIAHDPGGNMILLSIGGRDAGQVFFWDHDRETTPPTYANVYAVASDFLAFLDSLHDPEAR